jgi:MerR family transcriptional regulator, light-induced transcriptional regulator
MGAPADREPRERGSLLRDLREAYIGALLLGDDLRAERAVREAIDAGCDETAIHREILEPSMRRIGELWEDGTLNVADEHLATQITLRVLALEREAFRVARGRRDHRVMLCAVEGELHTLGLHMVHNVIAGGGYDTRFLGADVPIDSLAPIVSKHRPHVFALGATTPESGELLALAIDEVRRGAPETALLLGGQGVPAELREEPGLAVARGPARVVDLVDALVRRPELN